MRGGYRTGVPKLRLLFFLRIARLDRLYPSFLETLLEHGHTVDVVIERDAARDRAGGGGGILEDLQERYPGSFSVEQLAKPHDPLRGWHGALRSGVDYLRYFSPVYADASALRERAADKTPRWLQHVVQLLGRTRAGRELGRRVLLWLDDRLPLAEGWREEVRRRSPDAVLVSPLVTHGSPQANWIRVADELGIPSVLPVASWDNLSNKGIIKRAPSLTIVWNETQADEAVSLHRIPRERVAVTGAHSFDHWFTRVPSSTRSEFAARIGLPDDGPFFLYVCSSKFIAGDERAFVKEWLQHVRAHDVLRDVNVVVRPHPFNARAWADADFGDPRVVITPREGEIPLGGESRDAYFDAIHHSLGTVGLSTSVFVEAAILDRVSFTVVTPRYRGTQEGTLHFAHVAGPDGVLVVARDWDEHLEQLAGQLVEPDRYVERVRRFVETFVRPHGREVPAAPLAVAAVESLVV
jgi:hypothetical protein